MVNSGTNAATVMAAENSTARSTCMALTRISRSRSFQVFTVDVRCALVGSDPETALGEILQQFLPRRRTCLDIAEDVFDQDHRRIDDDPEVHGADRQQIGVLALQHQQDDREQQREGNVQADDDRAAQIAQEDPLDQEDQSAAEDQIVQNRVRGHRDQRSSGRNRERS